MIDTPQRASFSRKLPRLQLAWDSYSLGELKSCPRKYFYNVILGRVFRSENAHLRFGREFHYAMEVYDKARVNNISHEDALRLAVKTAMTRTWDEKLNRPWISDEPTKTRETLIRTIIWYADQFANDPAKTLVLSDGRAAVELSFAFELGLSSRLTGEQFMLCGHLDKAVEFQGRPWVLDKKTTKSTLSNDFFIAFSPDNQMSLYDIAGGVVLREPIAGIIIDAAQIGVTFSRFQRYPIDRTQAQAEEWLKDLQYWLGMAEKYAEDDYWPHNDKACYRCSYRPICSVSPEIRPTLLDRLYTDRDEGLWDPIIAR